MSYRNGYFKKTENLRSRPVDEWDHCLVFTPDRPNLVALNLDAWFIFELCGSPVSLEAIRDEYADAIGASTSPESVTETVQHTLRDLVEQGLLEHVAADRGAQEERTA